MPLTGSSVSPPMFSPVSASVPSGSETFAGRPVKFTRDVP